MKIMRATNTNPRFLHKPAKLAILIFSLSLAALALQAPDALLTGDSAVYNEQIDTLDLKKRSGHFGYYVLGIIANAISPFSTDLTINLLSSLCAALTIAIIFLLTRDLTGSIAAALVAAASLAFGRLFWLHAILSLYIMPQTLFITAAYYAWYKDRALLAGLAFLWAMLMTPLSALALPGFVLGSINMRKIALSILASLPLYGLFVWLMKEDFLWGPRGIFASGILDQSDDVSIAWSSVRMTYHLALNFNILLPLALVGGIAGLLGNNKTNKSFVLAVGLCMLVFVFFGTTRHHIWFHIPFYPLIASCVALGYVHLRTSTKARVVPIVVCILVGVSAFLGGSYAFAQRRQIVEFKKLCVEVASRKPSSAIVVSEWSRGMRYERYTTGRTYTSIWKNPIGIKQSGDTAESVENGRSNYLTSKDLDNRKAREVWVLDSESAGIIQPFLERLLTVEQLPNGQVWVLR